MADTFFAMLAVLLPGFLSGSWYFKMEGWKPRERKLSYVLISLCFGLSMLAVRCGTVVLGGNGTAQVGDIFGSVRNYLLYLILAAVLTVVLPNAVYFPRWLWGRFRKPKN